VIEILNTIIMKWLLSAFLIVLISSISYAQYENTDSLKKIIARSPLDTNRILLEAQLAHAYLYYKPDSSLLVAKTALLNAQKIKYAKGEARSYKQLGDANEQMGNYPRALSHYLKHLRLAEDLNMQFEIAQALTNIGIIYHDQNEYRSAIDYTLKAKSVIEAIEKKPKYYDLNRVVILLNAGYYYYKLNQLDSALLYEQDAYRLSLKINNTDNLGNILQNLGLIQERFKNYLLAITYYRMSAKKSTADKDYVTLTDTYLRMSEFYRAQNSPDSSAYYAKEAFAKAKTGLYTKGVMEASTILAAIYSKTDKSAAYDYLIASGAAKDSLFNEEKIKEVQNLKFDEQLRVQEINELKLQQEEEHKHTLQLSGIALFIPLFFLLLLLLSKIKIHHRIIEFMGVLSILFLFEFITLLIHPMVGNLTNQTPVLEFLILVCIAAVMAPLHHKFTHWLVIKLTNLHKWEGIHHKKTAEVNKE